MKRKNVFRSAFFHPRVIISFLLVSGGILLVLAAITLSSAGTAKAQTAQQPQSASRPAKLTPEEAQVMASGIKLLVNQSTEGILEERHPDGMVSMNVEGRFQNVLFARKAPDGTITQACINNLDAAAAFFEIDPQLVGGEGHTTPVTENNPVR